ncbi:MAG: MMPL family transporter [Pirellulaceae bacterium]
MESTSSVNEIDNTRPFRSRATRCAWILGAFLLISAPFVIRDSNRGLKSMFNAPLMWVDRDAEARQNFNRFLDLFGAHEMIVVTWPGCTVDDERLDVAAEAISDVIQHRAETGEIKLMNHVLTGNTMLERLTSDPINLSRKAALKRLNGVLVGDDGETSCLVVEMTDEGGIGRRTTIPLIKQTVAAATGLAEESLIVSGPSVDGLAIDRESIRSIDAYSIPSVVISLILCWFCLRSIWLTIPIIAIGAWVQGLMLALIYWSGMTMNAILIVLPGLVFVLTVSAGIHLAHYFLEELEAGEFYDAPGNATSKATGPCVLAALTTAIGLASLSISDVEPVRQFGFLGAIGVVVCVGLLFLFVPGFMVGWLRFVMRRKAKTNGEAETVDLQRVVTSPTVKSSKTLSPLATKHGSARTARIMSRYGMVIRGLCILAMIACGIGLTRLRTTVDVVSLLSEENQAVKDFHIIENTIGPLVPIEVVVYFDRDSNVELLDRLKIVSAVERTIDKIDVLEGAMSAVTFMPPIPRTGGVGGTARKIVFTSQVEQSREDLIAANYLAETEAGQAWRISARIPGQASFDYGEFLEELQSEVDELIQKAGEAGFTGVSSSSTGVLVLVYQVQKLLLADLFKSFLAALMLVAVVMMIALRSVLGGLLAMLPNVFPTLILFGAMGWMQRAVDIGTVMTASVALGIAVDGTFHFLKWFTQSLKKGLSQETAIQIAYQRCAGALIQTTIICACGLLVYSFSGFLPVRHFAWVLLMLLVAALFGDLVLLPALLAGMLGRQLRKACRRSTSNAESSLGAASTS